jgi:hypothetical protein
MLGKLGEYRTSRKLGKHRTLGKVTKLGKALKFQKVQKSRGNRIR